MLENVHGRRRRYNNLGTTLHPPDEILAFVEMCICQFYQAGTGISQVKELSSMLMYAYYLLLGMLMSEPTAKKSYVKRTCMFVLSIATFTLTFTFTFTLRWHMFITNQTESDRLPPTQGALY